MIEDALSMVVSFILVVLLLIIFPIVDSIAKQDDLIQIKLIDEVDSFVREIKLSGKIDRFSYQQFISKLDRYGQSFDIDIARDKRLYYPIYQDPLNESTNQGEMQTIFEHINNEELVQELYSPINHASAYYFKQGDYVTVTVISTVKSRSDTLRDMLWSIDSEVPSFYVQLSGMVAHEAY